MNSFNPSIESNSGKRRGFTKSKLVMSFYRATKPSTTTMQPCNGKPNKHSSPNSLEFGAHQQVKPKAPPSSTTTGSQVGFIIVNQEQVYPQQKPKVAFIVPERAGKLENFYGIAMEDEAVDAKAARYISIVQERFRLERVNSEHKKFEDMQLV